ncbi:lytic murein transglycosylase [Neokomagataea thailandica NBRC 106555]|uniref:Lytic transglycosylase domain-containing protein n=2 Tax=Neokomagataea TaxID=1223423 RepID=A0A4Y6VBQ0_9PROT|nr:lytic transglycosylase domain-containing protein [Neokomagataea tanensis]GBR52138.1 lytic murein transglycosylase [Neokomagataea thailandica NBRC 106555]
MVVSALLVAGGSFSVVRGQTARLQSDPSGTVQTEDAHDDETAFARGRSTDDTVVSLPHPLSAGEAAQYRQIFQAQRRGDLKLAQISQKRLLDSTLLGDVLADRYLAPEAKPSAEDLKDWLKHYASLPDAGSIQGALLKMVPQGAVSVQTFRRSLAADAAMDDTHHVNVAAAPDPLAHAFTRNPLLDRTVQERVSRGERGAESARKLVDATPGMTAAYAGQLYGEIALGLLSQGITSAALRTGSAGYNRGQHNVALPAYVAGLAAWRLGQYEAAYTLFENAANAPLTTPEAQASAAYWAGRASVPVHGMARYASWLHRAANHKETFYGLLAMQSLEQGRKGHARVPGIAKELTLHDPIPVLSEIDVEAVGALPDGQRLFALLQIGERGRAEAVMRQLWFDVVGDPARARSVQLVAQAAGFQDLSEQLASLIVNGEHQSSVGAPTPLPMPNLRPAHGFRVDPALVYALTRVESNFDPAAVSGMGAEGLMQIRPLTASFVMHPHQVYDSKGVAVLSVAPGITERLRDPASNLDIGQMYVVYLANQSSHVNDATHPSGGDLVRVLASYNAGPGAIARWEAAQQADVHDPLYFMETLPNTETRDYVHRALTFTWLYARRLHVGAPSLASLSASEWPSFSAEEALARKHAVN